MQCLTPHLEHDPEACHSILISQLSIGMYHKFISLKQFYKLLHLCHSSSEKPITQSSTEADACTTSFPSVHQFHVLARGDAKRRALELNQHTSRHIYKTENNARQ